MMRLEQTARGDRQNLPAGTDRIRTLSHAIGYGKRPTRTGEAGSRWPHSDELVEVMKFQSDPVAVGMPQRCGWPRRSCCTSSSNPDPLRRAREYEAGTRALDAHIAALKKKSRG